MTLLYSKEITNQADNSTVWEKWFKRIYRLKFLVPLFPGPGDEAEKWWYKVSFIGVLFLSIWFYLSGCYFIYLVISEKDHPLVFISLALAWLAIGVVVPATLYRLVVYTLKKQPLID